MILSDFLSRQKHDDSNLHEIVPISFNMQNILQTRYYNINKRKEGKYSVQTRLQDKSDGITLTEKQVIKPIISSEVKSVTQKIRSG